MKDYFNNLNDREKWMVIGGGICLIFFIYYAFLYAPLRNAATQQSEKLVEQIDTLEWMKKIKQEGHSLQKKQKLDNSQLLTLVATQLKQSKTINVPYQLEQTGSGEVQLSFDEVPFKLFITWLEKINETYSFTVKQLNIEKTKTSGVTKLMIVMSAG